ncbi:hypothetical protein U9M48_028588 [Paspalum notatum var. saurae]|uniref:Uncharacterized protein n=1 Tax=Paspalum notatum var. saurae TaxID=547442 RepID=A0AAQ3X0S1_PASNO
MPSLDKAIFSSPGMKRKREGKGFRQPRFKKAAVKPKPTVSAHPRSSESPDHSSHSRSRKVLKKRTLLNLPVLLPRIHLVAQTKFVTFDAASLLNFDPSTIGESLVTESPPTSPTTDVTLNLEEIAKQLEAPIEKLVVACDGIRTALEPIADMLPSGLK